MEPQTSPANARTDLQHISLPGLQFNEDKRFETELHRRVDEYFKTTGMAKTATPAAYFKVLAVSAAFFISYFLLVFSASTLWQGFLYAALVGFSIAGIGVNIQHEGAHNSFSKSRFINRLMAYSIDLVGGSSYYWQWKHNRFHHSFTNIVPYDTDIDLGILARIAPVGRHIWYQQWQHLYLWLFYSMLVIKWQLFDDFYNLIQGRLGNHPVPQPKGMQAIIFFLGKFLFFSWALAVPLLFHPAGQVLFFYAFTMVVAGMTLALIFILPHGVGEAEFPVPEKATGRMAYPRAVHQVRVTVDFFRNNLFITWLVGGLNYHREHHLFPLICHIHYPYLARIVDDVCNTFGIPHFEHQSYLAGLVSHFRWLKHLGKEKTSAIQQPGIG